MKVTVGQLLGIAQKGAAMDWKDLAKAFSNAPKNPLITRALGNSVIQSFQIAVEAFSVYQTVNDIIVKVRPVITLVSEIGGAIKNPAMWAQIGAEAISIIKLFLIKAGKYAITSVENYILNTEIDLGNLKAANITNMNKAVTKATNKSYVTISNAIAAHSVNPVNVTISIASAALYTFFSGACSSLTAAVNAVTDDATLLAAFAMLLLDQSTYINNVIYGQDTIPNTGGLITTITAPSNDFEAPDIGALEQSIKNPTVTPENIATINTDTVRELLDAIEMVIQYDINTLVIEIKAALATITAPVSLDGLDVSDSNILVGLTNSFLDASMEKQLESAQAALQELYSYNDADLKNILILVVNELYVEVRECMTTHYQQAITMINGFSGGMTLSDKKIALVSMLSNCLDNCPNLSDIIRKVLFGYLTTTYSNVYVTNTTRQAELSTDVTNYFGIIITNFMVDIIPQLRAISMSNKTIVDNYYNYSLSSLNTSLQNYITVTINGATVTDETSYNNLKSTLLINILSTITAYSVIVTENIPHDALENISDKIGILKNSLFNRVNLILTSIPQPPIDYTNFTVLLEDSDKITAQSMYSNLYAQFINSLVNKARSIIDTSTYENAILKTEDYEYNLTAHTTAAIENLKNNLYSSLKLILDTSFYSTVTTTALKNTLVSATANFNYILDFATTFSSYLKELEVSLIQSLIDNINT